MSGLNRVVKARELADGQIPEKRTVLVSRFVQRSSCDDMTGAYTLCYCTFLDILRIIVGEGAQENVLQHDQTRSWSHRNETELVYE